MSRFADTFFYLAVLNPRDAKHHQALQLARQTRGQIITTEFVIILSKPVSSHC